MLRKITCFIAACLIFVFSVSAEDEFLAYGQGQDNIDRLCEVLDMNAGDIKHYCEENNITYFACNTNNTKQIKRTEVADAFSKQVIDLSVLEDNEILDLSKELSGFKQASGKVVAHNGLKFLKTEHETEDNGGKYVLTQYITVTNSKKTVLSFYTNANESRDYIETVFKEQFPQKTDYKPFIIAGAILFGLASLLLAVLIIKELRKNND